MSTAYAHLGFERLGPGLYRNVRAGVSIEEHDGWWFLIDQSDRSWTQYPTFTMALIAHEEQMDDGGYQPLHDGAYQPLPPSDNV